MKRYTKFYEIIRHIKLNKKCPENVNAFLLNIICSLKVKFYIRVFNEILLMKKTNLVAQFVENDKKWAT